MSMQCISYWVSKLEPLCAEIETEYLDFIIDQSGLDYSIIPALEEFSPPLQWQSLYLGLPEESLPEIAPLLIRIVLNAPLQRQWFIELAYKTQTRTPLLAIGSQWSFSTLAEWLTDCVDATHEGRSGLFRYFDARLFPWLFSDILQPEQQVQLRRPALFWSWLDLDARPALLIGHGAPLGRGEKCQKIAFSDEQFEVMMCLCDVRLFLRHRSLPNSWFSSQEERFSACFRAMLDATKNGILLDNDREEWVMNTLVERHSPAE